MRSLDFGSARRCTTPLSVVAAFALCSVGLAQDISADSVATPVAETGGSGAELFAQPVGDLAASDAPVAPEVIEALSALSDSKFKWQGFLSAIAVEDDNMFYQSEGGGGDLIIKTGAFLSASYGLESSDNFVSASYAVDRLTFLDHSELDDWNHKALLNYRFGTGKLTGEVKGQYFRENGPDRNVQSFSQRDELVGSADFFYEVSGKTRVTIGAMYSSQDYADYLSSRDWKISGGFDYAVTGKTRIGMNGQYGALDHDVSGVQTYDRINGTLFYRASEKINFTASGGVDRRESLAENNGDGENLSVVYSLAAHYAYDDKTSFAFRGSRDFIGSPTHGEQNMDQSRFMLDINRKLGDSLALVVSIGYDWIGYDGVGNTNLDSDRQDSFWTARAQLNWTINQYVSALGFYEHYNNGSNINTGSFEGNRFGLGLMINF
jgi:Putative beta-barrel porin 2